MNITVRHSAKLQEHLATFAHDGSTVGDVLFEGGRLAYPGRKDIENTLGSTEPYTLDHEARVIDGLSIGVQAAVRVLSRTARRWLQLKGELDPTLELLWASHEAYIAGPERGGGEISLDRLIAALTMVQVLADMSWAPTDPYEQALILAGAALLGELEALGLPPSSDSFEELFDGAPPACVGLGMIDIDWKEES